MVDDAVAILMLVLAFLFVAVLVAPTPPQVDMSAVFLYWPHLAKSPPNIYHVRCGAIDPREFGFAQWVFGFACK